MKATKQKLMWVAALFLMILGTTAAASAQRWDDHDTTVGQVRSMDQFLDRHPEVAADLRRNPGLANDPYWLARHPEFREYLRDHRGVSEELHENPRAFMANQRRYEANEWRFNDRDDRRWDRDDHRRDRDDRPVVRDHDRDDWRFRDRDDRH